jgi:flagellar export protein FliJ
MGRIMIHPQQSNATRTPGQRPPRNSPLNAVVTVREQQEQAALQIYTAATREAEIGRQRLQGLALAIQSAATEFQLRIVRGCTANELAKLDDHCERLQRRRIECERAIRFAEEALKKALSCWHSVRQSPEVVEKHLEKAKRQAENRPRRKEQKAIDARAVTRKPRRQRLSNEKHTGP